MPGPQSEGKNANTDLKSIECFLDPDIIQKGVTSINIFIDKEKQNLEQEGEDAKATNEIEIKVIIDIM